MSSTSSSDHIKPQNSPILPPANQKKVSRAMKGRAIAHLNQLEKAICFFATLSIALLVASIALLAFAQARYIHPLYSTIAFGASFATFLIIKAIDCCQNSVARNNNLDLQAYYEVKYPPPPKKKKGDR